MYTQFFRNPLISLFLMLIMSLGSAQAAISTASLTSSVNDLVLQGNDLLVSVKATALTPLSMSTQINTIESDIASYQLQVLALYDTLEASAGSTLTLTDDLLLALQTLSTVSASLANATLGVSLQMAELAASTSTSSLNSSLSAMLRLSDDIGLMADRILEMANNILIMADNIGLMADRIVATQIIQSDNLKLVIDATLQTQTNTIQLIALFL